MKIGLTYDLRSDYLNQGYSSEETAEFDKESTIEGIEQAIHHAGFKTERIGHVQSLMKALLENKRWDLVFNIAEGLYGEGRESLVPALLDAYKIPYVFSGPVTLGIALNKAFAKQVVRDSGVNTPAFHVVSQLSDITDIRLEYPLFAKPISEGTGKGIDSASVINSKKNWKLYVPIGLKNSIRLFWSRNFCLAGNLQWGFWAVAKKHMYQEQWKSFISKRLIIFIHTPPKKIILIL